MVLYKVLIIFPHIDQKSNMDALQERFKYSTLVLETTNCIEPKPVCHH